MEAPTTARDPAPGPTGCRCARPTDAPPVAPWIRDIDTPYGVVREIGTGHETTWILPFERFGTVHIRPMLGLAEDDDDPLWETHAARWPVPHPHYDLAKWARQ